MAWVNFVPTVGTQANPKTQNTKLKYIVNAHLIGKTVKLYILQKDALNKPRFKCGKLTSFCMYSLQ